MNIINAIKIQMNYVVKISFDESKNRCLFGTDFILTQYSFLSYASPRYVRMSRTEKCSYNSGYGVYQFTNL